jgi:hypothetical protein
LLTLETKRPCEIDLPQIGCIAASILINRGHHRDPLPRPAACPMIRYARAIESRRRPRRDLSMGLIERLTADAVCL